VTLEIREKGVKNNKNILMCNKNGNDENSFCVNLLEWHTNLLIVWIERLMKWNYWDNTCMQKVWLQYNYWTSCWVFQAYVLNDIHVKVTHILVQHLYLKSILARAKHGYVASLANLHSEERLTHFFWFPKQCCLCVR